MLVFQMSPVVLRLALTTGGAGGLRRDFEFAGSHFPNEKNSNRLTQQRSSHRTDRAIEVRSDTVEQIRTALSERPPLGGDVGQQAADAQLGAGAGGGRDDHLTAGLAEAATEGNIGSAFP